jgi:hypothetical protein
MSFGHYNSVTTHASAPLDINGTVTITCSKGMATTIALDRGDYAAQAIGTTRAMKLVSADEYLNYELFQDVVRTTLWGSTGETLCAPCCSGYSSENILHFWPHSTRTERGVGGVPRYGDGDRKFLVFIGNTHS